MNIPILRLGSVYESCDQVRLDLGGGRSLTTHTANPGLIRRDLLRISEAKAALDAIPAETLADCCERAAEWFMEAELPCGDSAQSPDDYVESLSALTRLPHGVACDQPGVRKIMSGLVQEGVAVADALGITLDSDPEKLIDIGREKAYYHPPSMLQDILAERLTEIDALNGAIAEQHIDATGVTTSSSLPAAGDSNQPARASCDTTSDSVIRSCSNSPAADGKSSLRAPSRQTRKPRSIRSTR